ncbi:MoaD/ThiS family protein [Krasilnikovia sp. MM14-A1259]|uniref:MoaD/ThiS family protein n=1 Tax=Krasilnikovia sp. MM14-A1259 TaxID=3373539 RepID=UPI0037F8CAB5
MPTVRVPGVLRADAGGAAHLDVAADGSLRAVLDELDARWPRLARRVRDESGALRRYVNVYVDGEDCRRSGGLDTPVPPGAEIQILPSVAGGAGVAARIVRTDEVTRRSVH